MRNKFLVLFFLTIIFAKVSVRIESNPSNAHVKIDGEPYGLTPIEEISLAPGLHKIDLAYEEYVPIQYELDLQLATSVVLLFQLNQIHTITFNTQETGLNFVLDSKYNWVENKIKLKMEEGTHNLKVFNGDSLIEEKELKINEASEIFYELPLSESQLELSQQKVDEALKALKALQSVKDSTENE